VATASEGLQALKERLTGYDRWGKGCDFSDFRPLALYDRERGGWPMPRAEVPLTLLTKGQLDLVETLLAGLAERGIPGDCIEAGVWRGGTVILMRAALDMLALADRQVIAADSFCGIPPNTRFRHDPVDLWNDRWVASRGEVAGHLAAYGMDDERIELLEGLFADSLSALAGRRLAFIRLDCDSHDSVMDALTALYPLLMPGGAIVIDDWHLLGCRIAVDSYRKQNGIIDPIEVTAENGYWFKSHAYGEPA
jgi:O-methyltransferase